MNALQAAERLLLTLNRRHFIRLHQQVIYPTND